MPQADDIILVGGTGFIGRHLCCHLSGRGQPALVVSRTPDADFLSRFAPTISPVPLDDFLADQKAYFLKAKVLVHLASTSVPSTHRDKPWLELVDNVTPTLRLFAQAAACNPDIRIVYLSSGGTIYGTGYHTPIPEQATAAPISPYGYGKLASEEGLRFLGRTAGLNHAILRVGNPIGLWQNNPLQGIVNVALSALRNGETLTLFNGGNQIRDFLDADDLSAAIMMACENTTHRSEIWNVGTGVGTAARQIVELIETIVGVAIAKRNVEGRSVDADYAVLDCHKIEKDLGWTARTPLIQSLEKIISCRPPRSSS